MKPADKSVHSWVYQDEFSYCAHPHLVVTKAGTWVAVFNKTPRSRFVLHPPEQPLYHNVVIRSVDQGKTWSCPQIVPDYNFFGTECAGITVLGDGRLMLNQWCFNWLPLGKARKCADQADVILPKEILKAWGSSPEHDVSQHDMSEIEDSFMWARKSGFMNISYSDDDGLSFINPSHPDPTPFAGGYGLRGAIEIDKGHILLPLSDAPVYAKVFLMESMDNGVSWRVAATIGSDPDHEFEEPAIVKCRSGKLIVVMRDNKSRHLHQSESFDGGRIWTPPRKLAILGYPPHLNVLANGDILLTYGWRKNGFGIRATISHDEGTTWQIEESTIIRDDMQNKNLGYPVTVQINEKAFYTLYYGEDCSGVTGIVGTYWHAP